MQGSVAPEEFENLGQIARDCLSPVPSSLCPASKGSRKVPRDARDTQRTVGKAAPTCWGLFETVHQLTQVVASIAKSCPEHYANISFFARRLCLADLGLLVANRVEPADTSDRRAGASAAWGIECVVSEDPDGNTSASGSRGSRAA
jgi:hypothetical protein